jgi:hypothetical protein
VSASRAWVCFPSLATGAGILLQWTQRHQNRECYRNVDQLRVEQKGIHMRTSTPMAERNMATTPAEGHPLNVRFEELRPLRDNSFTSEGRLLGGLLVAFGLVTVLAGADVASDLRHRTTLEHALAEVGVVVVGAVGSAFYKSSSMMDTN